MHAMLERLENPAVHTFPGRLTWLLVALLASILVQPFLPADGVFAVLFEVFLTVVFLAAFFTVSGTTTTRRIGLALIIPALLANWAETALPALWLLDARFLLITAFLFYVAAVILRHVFRAERMTAEQVSGVGCAYLLLGMGWGYLYFVLESTVPGSLSGLGGVDDQTLRFESIYYPVRLPRTRGRRRRRFATSWRDPAPNTCRTTGRRRPMDSGIFRSG